MVFRITQALCEHLYHVLYHDIQNVDYIKCNKQSKSIEESPIIVLYISRQIDVKNVHSFFLALGIAIFALLFQ